MFRKIKNLIIVAVLSLSVGAPVLVPSLAFAADNVRSGICQGTGLATGGPKDCPQTTANGAIDLGPLGNVAKKVINVLSVIVGIIAVIMIIWGGFKYITSGGESSNVSGAKNTLIYAIVGLIIVALAQFIVHFVLTNVPSNT